MVNQIIDSFITELTTWLDTPYSNNAFTKGVGSDCIYFIAKSLETVGICQDFVHKFVAKDWSIFSQEEVLEKNTEEFCRGLIYKVLVFPAGKNELQKGDLILFRLSKRLNHAAIYLGDGQMIHCQKPRGTKIAKISHFYQIRMEKIYRMAVWE